MLISNQKLIFYLSIGFLLFVILFFLLRKKEGFESSEKDVMINILTRTGNRKKCYKKLEDSINKQTYRNFRHIKSNDNKQCNFLNNVNDVINVENIKKERPGHCPYNLYLNKLIDSVDEGWIIVLDDDAKFVDENYFKYLSKELKKANKDEILLVNIYNSSNKHLLPNLNLSNSSQDNLRKIKPGGLDMGCLVFHHTNKTRFKDECAGDIKFYKKTIENYTPRFINIKPGIWVNYSGKAWGKHTKCE